MQDSQVHFVFPAGVSALFWARETARIALQPIAPGRFIAWDDFKQKVLSVKQAGKHAINNAVRTLFASNFLQENRQKKFLFEYIPPQFADSYSTFISSLSKLLPSLDSILRRPEADLPDAYFADLRLIHEQYAEFLDKHDLYESAWNRAAFKTTKDKWMLFFSELVEDWEEYSEELTAIALEEDSSVRIIPLDDIAPPPKNETVPALENFVGKFVHFHSTGDEYKWIALICRKLLEDGLCPEDICISVAGNGNVDRLVHEFLIYGLIANPRQGKSLPKYPGGRIFSALASCPAKHWSYQTLKNLLLDKAFPWKERESINILMEFGMRYHCVSGFFEGFREIDVWEKTFEQHRSHDFQGMNIYSIEKFYDSLKKDILGVINAASFAELRDKWNVFQYDHFDRSIVNPETDKIIGKALSSLQELIEIGERFPELYSRYAGRAFPIFQAYIQEETYVYESKEDERSISVYAYKVAAGIAPIVHFIINVNQDDATIVYDGRASFLREDRKNRLSIQDRDISAEFIKAYTASALFPVFTVADRTFSGPTVPHRKLEELLSGKVEQRNLPAIPDPFALESVISGVSVSSAASAATFPSPVQKQGWEARKTLQQKPDGIDLRFSSIEDSELRALLEKNLCTKKSHGEQVKEEGGAGTRVEEETDRLSPTDLDEFLVCPYKWVLQRGLGIREKQTDIETLDQRDLGSLYHRILERLFKRIKGESSHSIFHEEDIETYKDYLKDEIKKAIDEAQSKEGYFQKPIYDMLGPRISASLESYLEEDAPTLNGSKILDAEYPLKKEYESGPSLSGIADLVLKNEGFILTDFKTKKIPTDKELRMDGEEPPKNVQIASYIAMLEQGEEMVRTARFYSIDNRKFSNVVDEEESPRPSYNKEIASVDTVVAMVTAALKEGSYMVNSPKDCALCAVSSVCRKPFIGEK